MAPREGAEDLVGQVAAARAEGMRLVHPVAVEPPQGVRRPDTLPDEGPPDDERLLDYAVRDEYRRLLARARAAELYQAGQLPVSLPQPVRLDRFLATPDEPARYRIDRLWPTGGRVVLAAGHKSGKSTLGANLLRSLVDGDRFLERFDVDPVERVVLIDDELDERMLRRWLRDQGIVNTARVSVVPLRGRLSTFNVLTGPGREAWARNIGPADVLLLDCLRPILDALALSEDKDAGRFLEALDELTLTAGIPEALVVHHMGHGGQRSRGDSRILDWPDAVWQITRAQRSEGEDEDRRRYFSAYGRDVDQVESQLSYDEAARRLALVGGSRTATLTSEAGQALVAYLAEHPGSSGRDVERELVDRRQYPRHIARAALADAVGHGVVRVEKGARNAKLHHLTDSPEPGQCASAP